MVPLVDSMRRASGLRTEVLQVVESEQIGSMLARVVEEVVVI